MYSVEEQLERQIERLEATVLDLGRRLKEAQERNQLLGEEVAGYKEALDDCVNRLDRADELTIE